jgi:hypothetical protein
MYEKYFHLLNQAICIDEQFFKEWTFEEHNMKIQTKILPSPKINSTYT